MSITQLELFGDAGDDHLHVPSPAQTRRVITIRENGAYSCDSVEVLDGSRSLGRYEWNEMNPHKLSELLQWFGHTVRTVDYMFEHDIEEYGN